MCPVLITTETGEPSDGRSPLPLTRPSGILTQPGPAALLLQTHLEKTEIAGVLTYSKSREKNHGWIWSQEAAEDLM